MDCRVARSGAKHWATPRTRPGNDSERRRESRPGKLDLPLGQEVEDVGGGAGDGGVVGAARRVDAPAGADAVEGRRALQRQDQVDLALGVAMMRADLVGHADHVDGEAPGRPARLDHPPEGDAPGLPPAGPALGLALHTERRDPRHDLAVGGVLGVEEGLERVVQRPVGDGGRDLAQEGLESGLGHGWHRPPISKGEISARVLTEFKPRRRAPRSA